MTILSFSLHGDATERITAWEREVATYERDGGKVLDDEIKIGTFLLGLPESQLKTHLLMRLDTLKKWTDFRSEVVAISRAISTAETQPTLMDVGAMRKGHRARAAREQKGAANEAIKHSKHVPDAGTRITLQRIALTTTRRAESA